MTLIPSPYGILVHTVPFEYKLCWCFHCFVSFHNNIRSTYPAKDFANNHPCVFVVPWQIFHLRARLHLVWLDLVKYQNLVILTALVFRNRNHKSVSMWGKEVGIFSFSFCLKQFSHLSEFCVVSTVFYSAYFLFDCPWVCPLFFPVCLFYRMSQYISHVCVFSIICLMVMFDWIVKDWMQCVLLHSEYSITKARYKCAKHMHLSIHLLCLDFSP